MSRQFAELDLGIRFTDIDVLCEVWSTPTADTAVWLRFIGDCERGTDPMWVQWQVDASNEIVEPNGMLIDVRELKFHELRPASLVPRKWWPDVLVVARPEQIDLLNPIAGPLLRTDFEAAVAEIEERIAAPRPPRERKRYDWTEVWTNAQGELRLLRHAPDGSLDIFDPSMLEKRQDVLRTFVVESDALDYLRGLSFHRVEGRMTE